KADRTQRRGLRRASEVRVEVRSKRGCGSRAGSKRPSSIPQSCAHQRLAVEAAPLEEAANLSTSHDHDAVGHADQLLDLGGYEEHCSARADHLINNLVDLVFGPDVDAPRRLVENEDRWRAQK